MFEPLAYYRCQNELQDPAMTYVRWSLGTALVKISLILCRRPYIRIVDIIEVLNVSENQQHELWIVDQKVQSSEAHRWLREGAGRWPIKRSHVRARAFLNSTY